MLKKCIHNHYYNPTNPKPQPTPKIKTKKQPPREIVHTKHSLQQPKENSKSIALRWNKTKKKKMKQTIPSPQNTFSSNTQQIR